MLPGIVFQYVEQTANPVHRTVLESVTQANVRLGMPTARPPRLALVSDIGQWSMFEYLERDLTASGGNHVKQNAISNQHVTINSIYYYNYNYKFNNNVYHQYGIY